MKIDQDYRKKNYARGVLQKAVREGVVKREPCIICGEEKSEGHHSDYDKPLDVVWLCRKHHGAYDAHIKKFGASLELVAQRDHFDSFSSAINAWISGEYRMVEQARDLRDVARLKDTIKEMEKK